MRFYIKTVILFISLLLQPLFSTSFEEQQGHLSYDPIERSELKGVISIKGTSYYNSSYPVGFQLELLNRFAKYHKREIEVTISNENIWDRLLSKEIDIAVINPQIEAIPANYTDKVLTTLPAEDGFVWITRSEDHTFQKGVAKWLHYYSSSNEYSYLESKYYRFYHNSAELKGKVAILSPYDQLIKEYSTNLNWDWRLVASIIYQESKFRVGAKSHRNATGLMQLLPATAATFGVNDLYNPEENIKAGTKYLKRLYNQFNSAELDSINQIKLTLAAYNAGEGRVEDILRVAKYANIPTNNWDSLKRAITLMSEGDLPEGVCKYGKFLGKETLSYVEEVISRYENYQQHIKR